MNKWPANFTAFWDALSPAVSAIEGALHPFEEKFLALLATTPIKNEGEILEIGSFKGRSTVILAKAATLVGKQKIVSVDPLTSPSSTCPSLQGKASGKEDFEKNLRDNAVSNFVEFHQKLSTELANEWNRPINLLWIDGDHTYFGAKSDFDAFSPFLVDKAFIAMHDVLHQYEGPIRIFTEEILSSPHFGACGMCRSIGWAQYHKNPKHAEKYSQQKQRLKNRLTRYHHARKKLQQKKNLLNQLSYKLNRCLIPHGEMTLEKWQSKIR